jgi:hypothetical protein
MANSQESTQQKCNTGGITIPSFKLLYRAIVIEKKKKKLALKQIGRLVE